MEEKEIEYLLDDYAGCKRTNDNCYKKHCNMCRHNEERMQEIINQFKKSYDRTLH